ncbi:MAG TPA: 2-phospho-L-lactate transferase [Acidimicrobiia bacterium]|nr:2-phospho-L-lactate transferase [Acidimicrobiia bacterium]
MIVALAGGVGSARFLAGLLAVVDPREVVVVGNTGDDDWFHGLRVCPDLDSVTYALAGANNPETGWGLAGETFATLGALRRYGVPTWFNIGDKDFATHLFRTERLRAGEPLSAITADIAAAWELGCRLLPMTDDTVATRITAAMPGGNVELALEEWFVRERCEPPVVSVRFDGAETARAAPGVLEALHDADVVVICPANPVLSIQPILAVPGIRDAVAAHRRVVGISNLIAGAAVRGPADRLLADLGIEASCVGVARGYRDLCDAFVIDDQDAARAGEVEALGVRAVVTDTLMKDLEVAAALARETLAAVA